MKHEKTDDTGLIKTPTTPADLKLEKPSRFGQYASESAAMLLVFMIILSVVDRGVESGLGSSLALASIWVLAFLFRTLCAWVFRAIKRPSADELVPHWAKQEGRAE